MPGSNVLRIVFMMHDIARSGSMPLAWVPMDSKTVICYVRMCTG